jgi:hypothetical protein
MASVSKQILEENKMKEKSLLKNIPSTLLIFLISLICIATSSCTSNASKTNDIDELTKGLPEGTVYQVISGSLEMYDINRLVKEAEVIVVGKVSTILPSEYGPGFNKSRKTTIHTDVIIDVQQYLYGQSGENQLVVRILGGRADYDVLIVETQPQFTFGEEVILFLTHVDLLSDEMPEGVQSVYKVVGSMQGKAEYKNGRVVSLLGSDYSIAQLSDIISTTKGE